VPVYACLGHGIFVDVLLLHFLMHSSASCSFASVSAKRSSSPIAREMARAINQTGMCGTPYSEPHGAARVPRCLRASLTPLGQGGPA
jgi:hypothetical protein